MTLLFDNFLPITLSPKIIHIFHSISCKEEEVDVIPIMLSKQVTEEVDDDGLTLTLIIEVSINNYVSLIKQKVFIKVL